MIERLAAEIRDLKRQLTELRALELPPFGIGARIYNSSDLIVKDGTLTTLTFDSERFDPFGMHTLTNPSRLTAPVEGAYLITFTGGYEANATGFRQFMFQLNGNPVFFAEYIIPLNSAAIGTCMTMTTLYRFSAADYVEVVTQQNSGGSLNISALANRSPEFAMYRVA